MAVLQDININVHGQPSEKRLQTFLRLSQNENGRMINFRVLGPPLPSGCTATFSGTKPDGNVYSKTGTVAGNFVVIQEDMQMTAVAGVWDAKLDIINGSHNIMTALIRVVIDADVVDPDAIASDSQLQGLVAEAKYYAEHARTDAYGSPLTAALKAEMTDKTRVYVYTGSESGMTAGNWYYWNGSAWTSGGVYNAVAVQTDTTLSVAGKAADGKATGDAVASLKEDLKEDIRVVARAALTEVIPYALTIGSGVNPTTGGNYNNQPRYARTGMISNLIGRSVYISLNSDEYEYVAWLYANTGTGSAISSPTNGAYISKNISFAAGPSAPYFRLGIQRKDHATMTSGEVDPTSDEYKLKNALKISCTVNNDAVARTYEKNTGIAIYGGVETPVLKNGGINFSSGFLADSVNPSSWSTFSDLPITLVKGDEIVADGIGEFYIFKLKPSKNGFERDAQILVTQGSYTADATGLYALLIQNVQSGTDVASAISVTHYGLRIDAADIYSSLPKNPYKNIARDKVDDNEFECCKRHSVYMSSACNEGGTLYACIQ